MTMTKTFTIIDVAKAHKITPKKARRRLRVFKGKAPASTHHHRWVWQMSAWKQIHAAVA
jgi:hypothetical protein